MAKVKIDKTDLTDMIRQIISEYDRQQIEKLKFKRDKRLRNTKLLLRNYNNFLEHYKNAVYTNSKIEEEETGDVFSEFENEDEDLLINSIKRTHTRTKIIIEHINSIMDYYRFKAENSNDEKMIRRFDILKLVYFSEEHHTYEQIAEMYEIDARTVSRDIKLATEELSVLMFGIDGLKMQI